MAAWFVAALAMAPLIGRAIARNAGFRDLGLAAGQHAAREHAGGMWDRDPGSGPGSVRRHRDVEAG
jgi:hypothetical protein